MTETHQHLQHLIHCIDLEITEQEGRFRLDKDHNLKSLKSEGLAIHPIHVTRKTFGYAEYPEISFTIPYPVESQNFRDGSSIECFLADETPVKGVLLSLNGKRGEFRLYAPDFPDWIEEKGVGIKLTPDQRTFELMKRALKDVPENPILNALYAQIHGSSEHKISFTLDKKPSPSFTHEKLNESQKQAVSAMLANENLCILHGPPGTGKTTVLIEGIQQLVKKGETVIVAAPSNAAVDHISLGLIKLGIRILRVGNTSKVNQTIFPFTQEGKMIDSKQGLEIKKLKIRAEELRKMAHQYKRSFGKDEREQRNLLFKEVRFIRDEIKNLRVYYEKQFFEKAQVIIGTPVGLVSSLGDLQNYNTLIIDEAGQCLEPLAWMLFPYAHNWVLAGDHLQLPPTVLSEKAVQLGFNKSILESSITRCQNVHFLNTQYRMRKDVADFSSAYFYNKKLETAAHLINDKRYISYFDTAGAGYDEETSPQVSSFRNSGEISAILKIIESENLDLKKTAFISPYSGQVNLARAELPKEIQISTIDSFQGQEKENIILSLVRSNEKGNIGFLKDYRRMNVALTRAKEKLFVIGDSSTIGHDKFYKSFLDYVEELGAYKSIWELL
jgi:ATP-dependent RNA/DNA helicase IGHMBP2